MANIRAISRRIRVSRSVSQITRAMEMVAASKMKKAQEKAISGKPYADKIYEMTNQLSTSARTSTESLALLKENNSQKTLVILISTNKGLCGGLNTNLFRQINSWFLKKEDIDFVSLGKKGEGFILRTKRNLVADFSENAFLESVGALADLIVNGYTNGEYKEVWLVYNNFVSVLNQTPTREKILPVISLNGDSAKSSDSLLEPNALELLQALLPHYLEVQIRRAILEAQASEHSATMIAMKNATDNANQLVSDLTLEYNKIRQQLITYEIADIVTAREAMQ